MKYSLLINTLPKAQKPNYPFQFEYNANFRLP